MKRINFLLGVHAHQPVGNFPFIFEEAYERSYRPFIEILTAHPRIKATLHYSGVLLAYFAEQHPDFLEKIRKTE